jgi:dsRNA-specific ribonuclease
MNIEKYLLLGEGDTKLGVQDEPSVMEDLFESIIGAIYVDSGNDMKRVINSVSKMLDVKSYSSERGAPIQSYKNSLQEWCADKKHKRPAPIYKTVSESGPDHKKVYERACYIGDKVYGIGQGKNLKLADSAAAEEALKALTAELEMLTVQATFEKTSLSVQKLKEYAAKKKKPTPEFRDLGETAKSTPTAREYEIECRFLGYSAKACAYGKREAKALAAEKILQQIEKESSKPIAKKPASVQKKTQKPKVKNPKLTKKPANKKTPPAQKKTIVRNKT